MIGDLGGTFLTGTYSKSREVVCSVCGKHGFSIDFGNSVKHCKVTKVPSTVVKGALVRKNTITYCKINGVK